VVTVSGARGEIKAIHHFCALPAAPDAPASVTVPDRNRRGEVPKGAGPVTARIDKQRTMAPANVNVRMLMDEDEDEVKVHALGMKGMFTAMPPTLDVCPDMEVTVILSVRTRSGMADIHCLCVITGMDEGDEDGPDALDLDIVEVNEPKGHDGLLSRYVRWLHFNALTSA